MGATETELERIAAAPGDIALFLDVDGTLLRIAPRPDAVQVEHRVVALLSRVHRAVGGALALITGRSLDDVDRLFAPLALPVAGPHGFERRDALGRLRAHGQPDAHFARARELLTNFAAERPGVLVEDKGLTLAVHYRMAPDARASVRRLAEEVAEASQGALAIQRGKMVVELKPAGRDKGTAIAEFMAEAPFRGRLPVFLGDDLTDEYGFSIVNGLGGLSVKVGCGPTEAAARLADVDAVRAWLERLVQGTQHAEA